MLAGAVTSSWVPWALVEPESVHRGMGSQTLHATVSVRHVAVHCQWKWTFEIGPKQVQPVQKAA